MGSGPGPSGDGDGYILRTNFFLVPIRALAPLAPGCCSLQMRLFIQPRDVFCRIYLLAVLRIGSARQRCFVLAEVLTGAPGMVNLLITDCHSYHGSVRKIRMRMGDKGVR